MQPVSTLTKPPTGTAEERHKCRHVDDSCPLRWFPLSDHNCVWDHDRALKAIMAGIENPRIGPHRPPHGVSEWKCRNEWANLVGSVKNDNGVRALIGSPLVDIVAALDGRDLVFGLEGDDIVCGGGGGDVLVGQDGDDYLNGGSGRDHLYGGDDMDTLFGGDQGDWLYGGSNDDTLDGESGRDKLDGGTEDIEDVCHVGLFDKKPKGCEVIL